MVDDQASLKIQNINRQFAAMGNQVGQTQTRITAFNSAINSNSKTFTASANSIKTQGNALANLNTNLAANSTQFTTLGSKVKATASQFAGFATGLAVTASGALQLAAGFRDYNDAQIAVERVQRKLSLATEAQGKATDKLNALTSKGIKSGKAYEQAQLDVSQANAAVSIQTQLLGEAQERLFDSQSQFVASVIPTTLGAFGTLGAAFRDLGGDKGMGGLVSKFKGLGTTIPGSIGGISGLTDKFKALGGSILGLDGPMKGLKGNLLGLGGITAVGIVGIIGVMSDLSAKLKDIKDVSSKAITPVKALGNEFDRWQNFDFTTIEGLSSAIVHGIGPGIPLMGQFNKGLKDMTSATIDQTTVAGFLAARQKDVTDAQKNYNGMVGFGTDAQVKAAKADLDRAKKNLELTESFAKVVKGTDDINTAQKKYNTTQEKTTALTKESNNTWALQAKALEGGTVKNLNLTSKAYLDVQNAIVKANPKITENIEKTRQSKQSHDDLAKALQNVTKHEQELTNRMTTGTRASIGFGLSFKGLTGETGKLAAGVQNLTTTYKGFTGQTAKAAEELVNLSKIQAHGTVNAKEGIKTTFDLGKAVDEAGRKIEEAKNKFEAFANGVQSARENLQKAFHIKLDDKDEFLKRFEKLLPDKISKKVKLDLNFTKSIPRITQDIQDIFKEASQLDEKTAEGMANSLIKDLDKEFGKKVEKAFPGLKAAIKAAIADPNTPGALAKLIETYPWLANIKPIEVPSTFVPPTEPIPPPKDPVKVPSELTTPPPLPPPKEPVKVPSTFIPPPPPPPPKEAVKVPAILKVGGGISAGGSAGASAGLKGGNGIDLSGLKLPIKVPAVLGFGPPGQGGTYTKKGVNEFGGPKDVSKGIEGSYGYYKGGPNLGDSPPSLAEGSAIGDALGDLYKEPDTYPYMHRPKPEEPRTKPPGTYQPASAWMGGGGTSSSMMKAIPITLNTVAAHTALSKLILRIDSIAKAVPKMTLNTVAAHTALSKLILRIDSIAKAVPKITLNTVAANTALSKLIVRIDSISNMKPAPTLNTKPANNALSALIKRIDSINNMKPALHLNTKPAQDAISGVIKRIDSIANMNPTVKVKFTGEGKLQATGSASLSGGGSIKIAQKGMHEFLTKDTSIFAHAGERVDIGRPEEAKNDRRGNGGGGDTNIYINVLDETIMRKIERRSGRNRFTLGV